jgi:dihydrofolate synthase/folylpolyglutamate synthase
MFISPHLHDYRERISIDGEWISPRAVIEGIAMMRPVLDTMAAEGIEHPTEFEVTTALAFLYFARKQPDFVLLEVGLGGEIDSTNVVIPLVSVLTNIGMDHMDYLGETLEEIAKVKAGIIKEGVPVVTAVDKREALRVIEQNAQSKQARLVKVGHDVRWEKNKGKENRFDYYGLTGSYAECDLSLLGEHQFVNASTALAVCEILQLEHAIELEEAAFRAGLRSVQWPGRLEIVCDRPKVLLDGAHNVDGMQALKKALTQYAGGPFARDKLFLCIGMLRDKEIEKVMDLIAPLADEIIVTKPNSPRAGDWRYVAVLARKHLDPRHVHVIEDPVSAVQEAQKQMSAADLLCVTGSLYMISEVSKFFRNRN